MEENLTLATPQVEQEVEDANVNQEPETGSEDETLVTTPEESQTEEYDKVWESEEEPDLSEETTNEEETQEEEVVEEPKGVVITKPLKYKGKEITVNSEDEAIALMQKGLDYEFKMTRIKPYRQAIDIIESSGLEPSDIKALADIKEGKKEAIDYLANKYGIEVDSDEEDIFGEDKKESNSNYEPEIDNSANDPVKELWDNYSKEKPQEAGKIVSIWSELDPTFQQELWNPQVFTAFIGSVETGEFNRVFPEAIKIKAINPALTWLQAYASAAQSVVQPQEQSEPSKQVQKKQTKKRSAVRNSYDDYDAVWNEDVPLEELEQQIFKGV